MATFLVLAAFLSAIFSAVAPPTSSSPDTATGLDDCLAFVVNRSPVPWPTSACCGAVGHSPEAICEKVEEALRLGMAVSIKRALIGLPAACSLDAPQIHCHLSVASPATPPAAAHSSSPSSSSSLAPLSRSPLAPPDATILTAAVTFNSVALLNSTINFSIPVVDANKLAGRATAITAAVVSGSSIDATIFISIFIASNKVIITHTMTVPTTFPFTDDRYLSDSFSISAGVHRPAVLFVVVRSTTTFLTTATVTGNKCRSFSNYTAGVTFFATVDVNGKPSRERAG